VKDVAQFGHICAGTFSTQEGKLNKDGKLAEKHNKGDETF
jgi:hypothetical protein